MENLLCGRDGGPKQPDLSLHSYRYAPQNYAIFDSPPHLLVTTPPKSDRLIELRLVSQIHPLF